MQTDARSYPRRKGVWLRMRRAALLPRRYGMSQKRFLANLGGMVSLLKRHGIVGTFPVTAIVLDRHPKLTRILEGMEVAVHGLRHADLRGIEKSRQAAMMRDAAGMLESHDLKPVGFRAPYLDWDETTHDAVAEAGFMYDSSVPTGWRCGKGIDDTAALRDALSSYGIRSYGEHLPRKRGSLVLLPVAMPDDEILIDRLAVMRDDKLARVLINMLDTALDEGSHLVLQLHPERFALFQDPLDMLLEHARQQGAWLAPLREVAEWWRGKDGTGPRWPDEARCAMTVSGDVDAVTLSDFVLRRLGR